MNPQIIKVPLNIDFKLLAKQKQMLLKTINYLDRHPTIAKKILPPKGSYDLLNGLVYLLDNIQDKAVDTKQIPESSVFPDPKLLAIMTLSY